MPALRPCASLLCAVLPGSAIAACGSSSGSGPGSRGGLDGLLLSTPKTPPPLHLRDYTGRWVSLTSFRGKAVLVTFVYTHCPDVCPLIVANLAAAQRQLDAAARRVQIIAVTVDPRRDTPRAIRKFLSARGASGRMDYLIGAPAQLLPVWRAWGVEVAVGRGQFTNGHSDMVYGITGRGRMSVIYPPSFTPAQIVHDVPVLARS